MCGGVKYTHKAKASDEDAVRKTYFPMPHAVIPVIDTKTGEIVFQQWGRRKGEDEYYPVPATGWARVSSLEEGKWDALDGVKVRLPVLGFMEKDEQKKSHWFDLETDTYLLGLQVKAQEKNFIYIITTESPYTEIHDRWPLIVNPSLEPVSHNPEPLNPDLGQLKLF